MCVMPEGGITGMQLLFNGKVHMTGLIDQTKINIQASDFGGKLDLGQQDSVSGAFTCSIHAGWRRAMLTKGWWIVVW